MPTKAPQWYEGQEFENPDDPQAPVLVWTKKSGFIPKERFLAQRGQDPEQFGERRQLLEFIDRAASKVGPWSTGLIGRIEAGKAGGIYQGIGGTPGYNLDRALAPVKANEFVKNLQTMRQNSPTGGAVGNVSNEEGERMSSLHGSMDIGQSPEDLRYGIDSVRSNLIRQTPGLSPDNPIDLNKVSGEYVPEGAYFRAPDGRVFINRKGAGPAQAQPASSAPTTPLGPRRSPAERARAAIARGGRSPGAGWSIQEVP